MELKIINHNVLKILKITKKKPLSVEVFADSPNEIYKQAKKIKDWDKNLYVKIPIVNTKGKLLNQVIKKVNIESIKKHNSCFYIKPINKN